MIQIKYSTGWPQRTYEAHISRRRGNFKSLPRTVSLSPGSAAFVFVESEPKLLRRKTETVWRLITLADVELGERDILGFPQRISLLPTQTSSFG